MRNTMSFPLWLYVYSGFQILLEVVLGVMILFNPASSFPEIADVAGFPIGLYAVRSIAVGLPIVFALVQKDAKMLWVCFLIRLITDLLDLGLIIVKGYPIPGIGHLSLPLTMALYSVLFYVPEILSLRKLNIYIELN